MRLAHIEASLAWPSGLFLLFSPILSVLLYVFLRISFRLVQYATWFRDVRGPQSPSWLLGNYSDFYKGDICDWMGDQIREYGHAFRFRAFLGEPRLLLSDPISLHHILVKHWQHYPKHPDFTRFIDCIMGAGLLSSEGEQYKRQKNAVQKSFTASSVKTYHPVFVRHARHLRHRLLQRAEKAEGQAKDKGDQRGILTDLMKPCASATIDVLSDAGFGQPFGALFSRPSTFGEAFVARKTADEAQRRNVVDNGRTTDDEGESAHPLSQAYELLLQTATEQSSSTFRVFYDVATWFVPELLWLPLRLTNHPKIVRSRAVTDREARNVIERARLQEREGKGEMKHSFEKDGETSTSSLREESEGGQAQRGSIIGQLIGAQELGARVKRGEARSFSPREKRLAEKASLTEEDVVNQVTTMMLAGHETTSTQIAWMLYALSKDEDVQRKLRKAVIEKRLELGLTPSSRLWSEEEARDARLGRYDDEGEDVDHIGKVDDEQDYRSSRDLTLDELESIDYLGWCIDEALRLYGPVHTSSRVALQDDVIPVDPKLSPQAPTGGIRIKKDACIVIPIEAINRNVEYWGKDAHVFNPDRWMKRDAPFFRHFPCRFGGISFFFGARSCIGARFAVAEIKTLIAILITDLAFTDAHCPVLKSRWVVTRPFDPTVGMEQNPVYLRKATKDDWL